MFGFLTPVRPEAADPLTDVAAAEAFWRTLPHDDPIAAQVAVCETLADPMTRGSPSLDRLRALLALDRARADARRCAALQRCRRGPPIRPRSRRSPGRRPSSFAGRSAGSTRQFLGSMRDSPRFQGWREYLPFVVLRLFQHRQIELTLRPFVDERSTRFPWKELHEVYRFAQSRELLHDNLPINRRHSASAAGHHAGARVHPRAAAGPAERRAFPAL